MSYIDNRLLRIMSTSLLGADRWPRTPDELNRFLRELIEADWDDPSSPIGLTDDLTFEQIAHAQFFSQCRDFLRILEEDKGEPLTATGRLNRASITKMIERLPWLHKVSEEPRRLVPSLKFNETDLMQLHYTRLVCECADLTCKRRNRLFAKREAVALLQDEQAGKLYRRLFVAFFRKFNLDYLTSFRDTPGVQITIAVTLWRLSLKAGDWIAGGKLPPEVVVDSVAAEIKRAFPMTSYAVIWMLTSKVLRPLIWYGLMECDTSEDDYHKGFESRKYRKTPLFDQFIKFVWKP